ncbi:hypothetical protein SYNPS1DRAFT_26488 [Syncephalis pseudoplumigaleata]|uniref:Lanthionine synthetase C-like protein n=1 Tax=Syncephalis pseudoplumigaleata TaxID=1712513 RepID=A0A4V1J2A5_9FUNG|nr:hypothetical protein SYNPS1DRAFT_26488 [Syncephalis pseudoplumigaleata]|eukprot:RKP27879.1 hypothetical protein SYNPS1DRAFT_26488 [Syncephalis pseudoplumigaleata]
MAGREAWPALLEELCRRIVDEQPANAQHRHVVPYTGVAGIAQLFLHVHDANPDFELPVEQAGQTVMRAALDLAGNYADAACCWMDLTRPSARELCKCGFLCTEAGVRAVAAVVYERQDRLDTAIEQLRRLLSLSVATEMPDTPSELLYGRAGYLYALGYVRHRLAAGAEASDELRKLLERADMLAINVYNATLVDGRKTARRLGLTNQTPLMWQWHGRAYLGAAHGMAGILTILMQWPELARPHATELRAALDFLLFALAEPAPFHDDEGGPLLNWPSSIHTPKHEVHDAALTLGRADLVQFCHGAPGVCLCAIKAYQTFDDDRYLQRARQAAETTWHAGIGYKGVGDALSHHRRAQPLQPFGGGDDDVFFVIIDEMLG